MGADLEGGRRGEAELKEQCWRSRGVWLVASGTWQAKLGVQRQLERMREHVRGGWGWGGRWRGRGQRRDGRGGTVPKWVHLPACSRAVASGVSSASSTQAVSFPRGRFLPVLPQQERRRGHDLNRRRVREEQEPPAQAPSHACP